MSRDEHTIVDYYQMCYKPLPSVIELNNLLHIQLAHADHTTLEEPVDYELQ